MREWSLKALKGSLKASSANRRKPQELKPTGKWHKYFHCGFSATLFSMLLHKLPHWLLRRTTQYHCRTQIINTTTSKQQEKDALSVKKQMDGEDQVREREIKLLLMAEAWEEKVLSPVRQSHTWKVSQEQVRMGKDKKGSNRLTVVQGTLYWICSWEF